MRHGPKTDQARRCTLAQLSVATIALSILTALVFAWVSYARPRAKMAACTRQLQQIGQAINLYRSDFSDHLPPWLSNLYPNYVKHQDIFICPSDDHRGAEGAIPPWCRGYRFAETNDCTNCTSAGSSGGMVEYGGAVVEPRTVRNADVKGVSYFYEFSISRCSCWMDFDAPMFPDVLCGNSDGVVSWREATMARVRGLYADPGAPDMRAIADAESASGNATPMVRCLWHASLDFRSTDLNKLLTLVLDGQHVYALDDHIPKGRGFPSRRWLCKPQAGPRSDRPG